MRTQGLNVSLLVAGALVWAVHGSAFSMTGSERDDLQIQVKPLGYDEVVSFYLGRGLEAASVEPYARRCVLRALLRNLGATAKISTKLNEWVLLASGQPPRRIEGRSPWVAAIKNTQPSHEARMAFEWSQLPDVINLDAGDSVQGMVSLPLQRGIEFELVIHWRSGGRTYEQRIRSRGCN